MATQNNTGLIVLSSVLGVAVVGGGIYLLTKNKAAAATPPKLPPVNTGSYSTGSTQSAGNAAAQSAAKAAGAKAGGALVDLLSGLFKPSKAAAKHPAGETVSAYDYSTEDTNSPYYDPSTDPNSDLYGYGRATTTTDDGSVPSTLSYDNPSLSETLGDYNNDTTDYGDFLGADGTTVKKVFDTETVFAAVLTGAAVLLIYGAYWKSQKD